MHIKQVDGTAGQTRTPAGLKRWNERLNVHVNICYLSTWIGAKRVGWPHHRLVVHHSWLCHHHGAHIGGLMREGGKKRR